jgi:hypothetical protein
MARPADIPQIFLKSHTPCGDKIVEGLKMPVKASELLVNRLDDDPNQPPKVCPDRHRWNEDTRRDLGPIRDNDEQSTYNSRQEQ